MSDLVSFVDFVVDVVCMMPALDEVPAITLTRNVSVFIALSALGLLMGAVIAPSVKGVFPKGKVAAPVVTLCVVALGFLGLGNGGLKGIFLLSYPPMVLTLRLGEGMILGARWSRHLRWWHLILLAAVLTGLYFLLNLFGTDALAAAKGVWAFFGAGLAAFVWTRMLKDSTMFSSPFAIVALYAVFLSTVLYVSTSPFERALYQCVLPGGLLIGIVVMRISEHRTGTPGSGSSAQR